jgi:Putative prokaryotic signal transducing protein
MAGCWDERRTSRAAPESRLYPVNQQSTMHEALITIATFHSQPEFLLARARLESADIECFAQDENMLRIGGWHSHILGGIKLQVRESDVQDALAILRHPAQTD